MHATKEPARPATVRPAPLAAADPGGVPLDAVELLAAPGAFGVFDDEGGD